MFAITQSSPMFRIVILFLVFCECQSDDFVDLGHVLDSNSLYFPHENAIPFELSVVDEGYNFLGGGFWFSSKKFCSMEHVGTHLDAPYHFAINGWKAHEIPLEHLIAQAVVIDVREKVKTNSNYELSSEDVQEWIETYGQLPNNSIVLVNTGWSSRYSNRLAYFGHESDYTKFAFPGIGITAANFLLDLKQSDGIHIVGVGVDSPTIDSGKSMTLPTHLALLGANVYGLENLNNLHELPPRGIELTVMPMKIRDGTGAPSRVIARIGSDQITSSQIRSNAAQLTQNIFLAISSFVMLSKLSERLTE